MSQRFITPSSFVFGLLSVLVCGFAGCGSAHGETAGEPATRPGHTAVDASLDHDPIMSAAGTSGEVAAQQPVASEQDAGIAKAQPMAAHETPVQVQVSCTAGVPDALPMGIEVIATDVAEHLWTASAGMVTWISSDMTSNRLWRKSGDSAVELMPLAAAVKLPDLFVQSDAVAADGDDVFVRQMQSGSSGSTAVLSRLSDGADAFYLARAPGSGLGPLVVDDAAVYWMTADGEQLSAWRTARDATSTQDTQSLGALTVTGWSTDSSAHLAGPIALGDHVYAARSLRGKARVLRASKDGRSPLAAFGPELPAVSSMTSDGDALLLALESELDDLGNVHTPPRIVRMSADGALHDVATIDAAGPSNTGIGAQSIVVNAGRAYWNDNQQAPGWIGSLWSAPIDGSSAPVKVLTTPGNLISQELATDANSVIFALYCRVDYSDNQVGGRTHLLRMTF